MSHGRIRWHRIGPGGSSGSPSARFATECGSRELARRPSVGVWVSVVRRNTSQFTGVQDAARSDHRPGYRADRGRDRLPVPRWYLGREVGWVDRPGSAGYVFPVVDSELLPGPGGRTLARWPFGSTETTFRYTETTPGEGRSTNTRSRGALRSPRPFDPTPRRCLHRRPDAPSLVWMGLARTVRFVLAVTPIDQLRRQRAPCARSIGARLRQELPGGAVVPHLPSL